MKMINLKWIALLPAILLLQQAYAQEPVTPLEKVEKCIRLYGEKMSLGKPETGEMNSETIKEFKSLFELGASVYWDLYKENSDKLPNMSVSQYTDTAFSRYNGRKPKVSLSSKNPIIKIKDTTRATVFLIKKNEIPLPKKPQNVNTIKLRMQMNIYPDQALIENIMEDPRKPRVRSISANFGYMAWNNVHQEILSTTDSEVDKYIMGDFSISSSPVFTAGISLDFRIDRVELDGLLLETGLMYSRGNYDITINEYEYTYRDQLDETNSFECDVFDTAKMILEKLDYQSFSLPLLVKYYPEGKKWVYLKAGPVLTYQTWNMEAGYMLSHTGGGLVQKVDDPAQYFNVSPTEFQGIYGFNDNAAPQHLLVDPGFKTLNIAFLVGAGFEKRFTHFSIGLEPVLMVGPNAVQEKDSGNKYLIYQKSDDNPLYGDKFTSLDPDAYHSFTTTLDLPSFSLSGMINLRFSYFF
jgi:hypothetical protein